MLFCNGWVSALECDARHIVEVPVSDKLASKFSVMGAEIQRIEVLSRLS